MQAGDVAEPFDLDAFARLLEHLRGKIDADDLELAAIARQRQARADADLEHPAAAAVDDLHRVTTASVATRPKV